MRRFLFQILLVVCFAVYSRALDVERLLNTLTLEEKIGQMTQIDIAVFFDTESQTINYAKLKEWINTYKIGSVLNSIHSGGQVKGSVGWTPTDWRYFINKMQQFTQDTESKIPIIYGVDTIHGGTYVYGSALFPQALSVAATYNPALAYTAGAISSKDTRAAGIPWLFNPVLGLALQPLWSRFEETFGEDPYLAAQMGAAGITGIQAVVDDGGIPRQAAACMKHFIAYSDPEDGHDRSPVQLPDRVMQQLYRPAFQAAIDAGVMSAMESYQEVGGIPMASSKEYLKSLLRHKMGFEGMMVTDYSEIKNLHDWHLVAASQKDAVQMAMSETSIDMSMVPTDSSFPQYLIQLVEEGIIPESRIDESVRRVLALKDKLGLFENPVPALDDPLIKSVGSDEDWEAALDAARESITLVKNNDDILPLKDTSKTVFLAGPALNSLPSQSGSWTFHWQGATSNEEFTRGVSVQTAFTDGKLFPANKVIVETRGPSFTDTDLSNIDMTAVLTNAALADVIVVCVGEGAYAEKPGDIDDLDLPTGQVSYVKQLATLGKPIVLVLVTGRPRLLQGIVELSSAVLNTYRPGPLGGQAIGEIFFGLTAPSGRMPYTYPKFAGDMPYSYHRKPSDRCVDSSNGAYIDCRVEWSFGHGLSYSKFEYSPLKLSSNSIDESSSITVTTQITNHGPYDSKHSVLLFMFDMYRRVTPEYKLLKRFSKVDLKVGETTTVSWTLTSKDLEYVGIDSRYILENGEYRLGLGPDTDCRKSNSNCAAFTLEYTSNYLPICAEACSIWSQGICGRPAVSSDICMATCGTQEWTWQHVQCLEEHVMSCPASFQCFYPFAPSEQQLLTGVTATHTAEHRTTVAVVVSSALLGAVLAGAVSFVMMRKQRAQLLESITRGESSISLLHKGERAESGLA